MSSSVITQNFGAPRQPVRPVSQPAARVTTKTGEKMDVLRLAVGAALFFNVCRVAEVYPWMSALRPGLLLTAIAIVAALMNTKELAQNWPKRWPMNLLWGILFMILGSIAFGISQGSAFFEFTNTTGKMLIGVVLVIASLRSPRDLWRLTWAYVFGAAVLSFLCVVVFGVVIDPGAIARLDPRFSLDANDAGLMALLGLPLSALAIRTSKLPGKLFASGVIVGIGLTIVKTGSRGAFLGLAAVLLAFLVSLKGTSIMNRVLIVVAILIGAVLSAPKGYWQQMNTVADAKQDYNWSAPTGRRQVWLRGLGYVAQYPIFGVGLGNFGRAEGQISDRAKNADPNGPAIKWSAPHNSFLQAAAETGIPGEVLFVMLVFGAIAIPWRLRKRIPLSWSHGTWEQQYMFHAAVYLPLAALAFSVSGFFLTWAFLDPIYVLASMAGALHVFVERELAQQGGAAPAGAHGHPIAGRPVAAPRPTSAAAHQRRAHAVIPHIVTPGPNRLLDPGSSSSTNEKP